MLLLSIMIMIIHLSLNQFQNVCSYPSCIYTHIPVVKYQGKIDSCNNFLHHIFQIHYDNRFCDGKFGD